MTALGTGLGMVGNLIGQAGRCGQFLRQFKKATPWFGGCRCRERMVFRLDGELVERQVIAGKFGRRFSSSAIALQFGLAARR